MAYIEMDYKSESLCRNVTLQIILPCNDGWQEAKKPFRTLYFLNGFSSSAREMAACLSLRFWSMQKGIAVVLADGDNSFYVDAPDRMALYGTFVGQELVEVTRSIFPLSGKREDTYIGGISMGGYSAIRHGLLRPDTFGKIAAMSPGTHAYDLLEEKTELFQKGIARSLFGEKAAYLASERNLEKLVSDAASSGQKLPELFLCCGRQDELAYECNQAFLGCLRKNSFPVEYREKDGGHDILFWEAMLETVFEFLSK